MSWLWRIIAALLAFGFAWGAAYAERSLGHALAQAWRLLGVGFIVLAALLGLALLVSGLAALSDARQAPRR